MIPGFRESPSYIDVEHVIEPKNGKIFHIDCDDRLSHSDCDELHYNKHYTHERLHSRDNQSSAEDILLKEVSHFDLRFVLVK